MELLRMKAKTRNGDPQSSREAAKRIEPHIDKQQQAVLDLFGRAKRGYTAAMLERAGWKKTVEDNSQLISDVKWLDRYQISRRLPELEKAGKIERVGVGACLVKGVPMTFWRKL